MKVSITSPDFLHVPWARHLRPIFPPTRLKMSAGFVFWLDHCKMKMKTHSCFLFYSTVDLANDVLSSKNDELLLAINVRNMIINFCTVWKIKPFSKLTWINGISLTNHFYVCGVKVEQEMTGGICNLEEHVQISGVCKQSCNMQHLIWYNWFFLDLFVGRTV